MPGHVRGVFPCKNTTCVKDLNYVLIAGTLTNLLDVINKDDHGRNRKQISAAFAIKNLERWEFKVAQTTQRLINAMDAHCTAAPAAGQAILASNDVTFDWGQWAYFFTIEAINSIALSSQLGLPAKGSDVITAQKRDGMLYQARYREIQHYTALGHSTFVLDYRHYPLLLKLSKLSSKWRNVWRKAGPWGDIIIIKHPRDYNGT